MNLHTSVAIITGASSGIGAAIARALAARGARLVLTARREAALNALRDEIGAAGGTAVVVAGDLTQAATAEQVAAAARERFGQIDVLVNNAGYAPPMPLVDLTEQVWDATINTCLKSAYLMTRAVLPTMLGQGAGRIVQISSVAGKRGYANRTAYCAAKWGLQGFTEALRAEVGPAGIRAHVIHPAAVATDWWATTDDPQSQAVLERMLQPEDVAQAAVLLLTQPDYLQVDEIVLANQRSPWQR